MPGSARATLRAETSIAWRDLPAELAGTALRDGVVVVGPSVGGNPGIQIAVATASQPPTRPLLRELHKLRLGRTQATLIVAVTHADTTHVFGPDSAEPIALPAERAHRQLQSILDEPDVFAATDRAAQFRKAHDAGANHGFVNSGLFAIHHLTQNVRQRADWPGLNASGTPMLSARGKQLIEALGFAAESAGSGAFVLKPAAASAAPAQPAPRAVAILLDDAEQFEARSTRFQLSPVAYGLALAAQRGLPWLIALRKDQIRLYPGRDGIGVGAKGQAETYFEIDLATVDADFAGLLPLVFSADALADGGTTDELLRDSAKYATELGARLRERIYEHVVPALAIEVAGQLVRTKRVALDADGLARAYQVAMRILFRLLFQAYAEDRGLLPQGRNEGYDANALKTLAKRLLAIDPATDAAGFGDAASLWLDLVQVWNAIDQGNPQWQVPAYNGGLFSAGHGDDDADEGALIAGLSLSDKVVGPALRALLIDVNDEGVEGIVDFRSLSVREFGTIYEGLLESSLSVAGQDLMVDAKGAWVPADAHAVAEADSGNRDNATFAAAGTIYFHSKSGERKATGSYFTPKVIVDHLIERSIVPALDAHLARIDTLLAAGDAAAAARDFFDFRVADLAMGSGHFLIAAVDKIEALMRTFLTRHQVNGVAEELLRMAAKANEALGSDEVAKSEVDGIGLLRRQIARRCIYGLDINPMAVELSRLALWIHTFVPGLPMSNLDHGLVCANSLTGIGSTDEALDILVPGREYGQTVGYEDVIELQLAQAKALLIDAANASEASKAEVEEGARLYAEAKAAVEPVRRILDAAVAVRLGAVKGEAFSAEQLRDLSERPEVADVAARLRPAHMPVLFPEVFLRENAGFDVLLGNPPWEKLKIETDQWWGLRLPGLRSMPQREKNAALSAFRASRPDLEAQFEAEQRDVLMLNEAVRSGPFTTGAGDTDLYHAFAWRNWQLLREHGRSALVLPRGALAGSALAQWRRTVIGEGAFESVVFLVNGGNWIFENVDGRYTVGLTVLAKTDDHAVRFAGPFHDQASFLAGQSVLADVPGAEFLAWSGTSAFPLIPDPMSAQVFRQMKRSPRFDAVRGDWEFRPFRELDATGDKALMQFDTDAARGRIPIVTGASYNIWEPDAGTPYAYADPGVLRPHLAAKFANATRNSRSAYLGMRFADVALPLDSARIAFRDIARATDSRTTIACLLPPGTSPAHQSPVLVRRRGDTRAEAFLLGVLSSIPFDWSSRRWVELHLTFELLNTLPVPAYDTAHPLCARVVEIAGRLAAVDDRYVEWAAEVGVPVGSVTTPAEKDDLIAELDALVSLLYGLSEEQVVHVFATFHRGWDYQSRLDAVLAHYRAWQATTGEGAV